MSWSIKVGDTRRVLTSVPDIVAGIKWLTKKEPPNIHQLRSRVISECV